MLSHQDSSCTNTSIGSPRVKRMCCSVLSQLKLYTSVFMRECPAVVSVCVRPLRFSNRSAGEHLDVRLLLILPSPFIPLFHPSPLRHSSPLLWAVKRMKGSVSLPKRERGREVERRRERLGERDRPPCTSVSFSPDCTLSLVIPRFLLPSGNIFTHSCLVFAPGELRIWRNPTLLFLHPNLMPSSLDSLYSFITFRLHFHLFVLILYLGLF